MHGSGLAVAGAIPSPTILSMEVVQLYQRYRKSFPFCLPPRRRGRRGVIALKRGDSVRGDALHKSNTPRQE